MPARKSQCGHKNGSHPTRQVYLIKKIPLETYLETFLTSILQPGQTLLLAFSGGLDSCVLLHMLAQLQPKLGIKLKAMHVHHGLSPNADAWAKFCSDTCVELKVSMQIAHVNVLKNSGLGLEASARAARYAALLGDTADYMVDYVVLAHHQDDQAETLLLQLLRGAGVKGLSAMAAADAKKRLLRPLLAVSRAELQAYATQYGLQWIEDESNQDTSLDRNFCRHQIFPLLEQRFPAAKKTLARSASHMAEAALLLDELAAMDAVSQTGQPSLDTVSLPLQNLHKLSEARARNLLRWWLARNHQPMPSTVRLQEMLRQLQGAKADASIKLAVNSAEGVWLRRYQGFIYLEFDRGNQAIAMLWQGEPELRLPDNSRLIFTQQLGQGLAFERLSIYRLRISQRIGGEQFKPDLAKPTRTLKHLLQEAKIPPWQRQRLPLIYSDDTLAIVPGIGVACGLQARENELGLLVIWEQA